MVVTIFIWGCGKIHKIKKNIFGIVKSCQNGIVILHVVNDL